MCACNQRLFIIYYVNVIHDDGMCCTVWLLFKRGLNLAMGFSEVPAVGFVSVSLDAARFGLAR